MVAILTETIRTRVGLSTENGADKEYRIIVEAFNDGTYMVNSYNGKRGRATTPAKSVQCKDIGGALAIADRMQAEKEKGKSHYHFTDDDGNSAPSPVASKKIDTGLRPQLQTPIDRARAEQLANDDAFFSQQKYDGEHLLVQKHADGTVTFANKLGFTTSAPAYIEQAVLQGPYLTLSGELLSTRYVVYDVLAENGFDIRHYTYEQRLAILERYRTDFGNAIEIAPTAKSTREKSALLDSVEDLRGEGWIFKRKDAAFTEGRKHHDQFKCKRWKSATCIVHQHNEHVRSVQIAVLDGDEPVFVGNVTVKADQAVPPLGAFIEVKYLDYRAGGALTQPELLKIRTDVTAADCTIKQLEGLTADN